MVVRLVAKLLALLNSNRRAAEIGASLSFGLWLALLPAGNLLFAALVLVVFLARINLGIAIASQLVFSLFVPLADPAVEAIGLRVLTLPSLQGFFRAAWATPLVPLTRFNDSIVAGGLVSGAALFVPVLLLGVLLVRLYRRHIHARIVNSRLVKAFMKLPLVQKITGAVRQVQRVWPTAG